jgi:DNA-binding Lrp family transcriptional regulator
MTLHDHAPDYRRGYLRVPLDLWRTLYCRAPLTRRQLQLVSVVIRESWGWQQRGGEVYRWTRPLTVRQLAEATGLSTDHLARDLRELVARGVLLEQERRYQVVPDPALWIASAASAPKTRSSAPKRPDVSAETALASPGLKTAKKRQRNVGPLTRNPLSPAVDKSRPVFCRLQGNQEFTGASASEARFVQVVAEFVGGLPEEEIDGLHSWIQQDGVPAVWSAVEDSFRQGPRAVRRCLEVRRGNEPGTAAC